jgi:hypothetical protein
MGLFKKSKNKKKKTKLDEAQELSGVLIVNSYRKLAELNESAPTSKTPDQKIIEIYQKVGSAFREAAAERGEHIPAGYLNTIVYKFLQIYEMMGEDMLYEHLKYEIEKYIEEGLREDYKKELNLF